MIPFPLLHQLVNDSKPANEEYGSHKRAKGLFTRNVDFV